MQHPGRRRATDPYLTSHKSDFPGYPSGLYAEAVRPMTAQGAINPKTHASSKVGPTTHNLHFSWKPTTRVEPIRSGSSSGTRNNNPHPDNVSGFSLSDFMLISHNESAS